MTSLIIVILLIAGIVAAVVAFHLPSGRRICGPLAIIFLAAVAFLLVDIGGMK